MFTLPAWSHASPGIESGVVGLQITAQSGIQVLEGTRGLFVVPLALALGAGSG